jgi:hypothetical protein
MVAAVTARLRTGADRVADGVANASARGSFCPRTQVGMRAVPGPRWAARAPHGQLGVFYSNHSPREYNEHVECDSGACLCTVWKMDLCKRVAGWGRRNLRRPGRRVVVIHRRFVRARGEVQLGAERAVARPLEHLRPRAQRDTQSKADTQLSERASEPASQQASNQKHAGRQGEQADLKHVVGEEVQLGGAAQRGQRLRPK